VVGVGEKKTLQIAFCFPVLESEKTNDASFLQQLLITKGLVSLGHRISYIAPISDFMEVICTQDIATKEVAARTWTRSAWFNIARKVS
jgi:hypothetical protein